MIHTYTVHRFANPNGDGFCLYCWIQRNGRVFATIHSKTGQVVLSTLLWANPSVFRVCERLFNKDSGLPVATSAGCQWADVGAS